MKIFQKTISVLVCTILLISIFIPSFSTAQQTPPPQNPWTMSYGSDDNKIYLNFKTSGGTSERFTFSKSLEENGKEKNLWHRKAGDDGKVLYAVTDGYSKVIDVCVPESFYYKSNSPSDLAFAKGQANCNVNFLNLKALPLVLRIQGKDFLNDYTSDATFINAAYDASRSVWSGQNGITEIGGRTATAPKDENITKCGGTNSENVLWMPYYYNWTDQEVKDRLMTEVGQLVANDPANAQNTQTLKKIYENIDASRIRQRSTELYKQFYRSDFSGTQVTYPDVQLTDAVIDQYLNLSDKVNSQYTGVAPLSGTRKIIAALIAKSYLNTLTMGAYYAATQTTSSGRATTNGIEKWIVNHTFGYLTHMDENEIRDASYAYIDLYLATGYIIGNEQFNECLAANNDPYAYINPNAVALVTELLAQMQSYTSGAQVDDEETVCDKIRGNGVYSTIAQGFCAVAIAVKKFNDTALCWAQSYLEKSIGIVRKGETDPNGLPLLENAACPSTSTNTNSNTNQAPATIPANTNNNASSPTNP